MPLVVQEALEMTLCFRVVGLLVDAQHDGGVFVLAGAEMMTFFAPL